MKKTITIITLVALVAISVGCKKEQKKMADDSQATGEGVQAVVKSINDFAFKLYGQLNKNEDGNMFFSPYSLSTAFAMAYEGAKGQTAKEIQEVFGFPLDASVRQPAFARVYNQINAANRDYKLYTANAFWAHQDYQFLQEYLDVLQKYYAAEARNVDFINQTEQSRQTINNWIAEQTQDKIQNLFGPGTIDSLTRLVLTNAIYFKGDWAQQFDKSNTKDEDFTISSGNTVKIPMMSLTKELKFNYAEIDKLQLLEMPYKGEELAMLIILPKEVGLAETESNLNTDQLTSWRNSMSQQTVHIHLPRFRMETKYHLVDVLSNMGMSSPFEWPGADFSGMDGTEDLSISQVIHQAYVDVDEEGTEAAGATGIGLGVTAVAPKYVTFRADHPFIFLIQDNASGNILFIGRVVDPR